MKDNVETVAVYACPWVDKATQHRFGVDITPAPGCTIVECEMCKEKVFIGPAQAKRHASLPGKILCFMCVAKITGGHDAEFIGLAEQGNTYTQRPFGKG